MKEPRVWLAIAVMVVVAVAGWLLIQSVHLGTYPSPAAGASEASRVGSYLVQFGLVVLILSAGVALAGQVAKEILGDDPPKLGGLSLGDIFAKLVDLLKFPAGIGAFLIILGVFLMFPSAFPTTT